jgi:hypothetical protein
MSTTPAAADAGFAGAVDNLYSSFSDVPFRRDMPRCGHCVSQDDVEALEPAAHQLPPHVVGRFVTKAVTTWGTTDDLRRVAPRALHLAADNALPVNRSVVLQKLTSADWSTWPAHQVEAVCRFLLAEWERVLDSPPRPGRTAHRWIRQTATATADLGPFLRSWQRRLAADPGPAAVHLAVLLVGSELRPDFPTTVVDLFTPPAPGRHTVAGDVQDRGVDPTIAAQADQLSDWLASPATEADLARAASALDHTTDARRLALAVDRVRRFRLARSRPTEPAHR